MSKILIFVLSLVFINSSISEVLDMRGNSVSIPEDTVLTQDKETGIIYGSGGRSYIATGEYKYPVDDPSNPFTQLWITKKCSQANWYFDPLTAPNDDNEKPGDLPGGNCKIQQISGDPMEPILLKIEETTSLTQRARCDKFAGYAPPLRWGRFVSTVSHIGPTIYRLSVEVFGDTNVTTAVKYWAEGRGRRTIYFIGSTKIRTGNAAATVKLKYKGYPFGSAVKTKIC